MYQGYEIETGWSREEGWIREDAAVRYKTVRTSSGRKYRMKMDPDEIEGRRILGMIAAIGGAFPACMVVMFWAAGLLG